MRHRRGVNFRRAHDGWSLEMSFKSVATETFIETAIPVGFGLTYDHPAELLNDPGVGKDAKRALLAAWASDRHAIEGAPTLRQLDSGAIVKLADIMQALKELDRPSIAMSPPKPSRPAFRLLRRPAPMAAPSVRPDNDPPPRPVRMKLGSRFGGVA